VNTGADDFESIPEPPPMVMESAAPPVATSATPIAAGSAGASSDAISVESMRNAMIANFEQADLDVPAFLRKRNDAI
jgi:hypothetical protein